MQELTKPDDCEMSHKEHGIILSHASLPDKYKGVRLCLDATLVF